MGSIGTKSVKAGIINSYINRFIYDYRLKHKLYILIVLINIIPILTLSTFLYFLSTNEIDSNIRNSMAANSQQMKMLLDSFFYRMVSISDGIIQSDTIQEQLNTEYTTPKDFINRNHILRNELSPWINKAFVWESTSINMSAINSDSIYISFYLRNSNAYLANATWANLDLKGLDSIANESWFREMSAPGTILYWRGSYLGRPDQGKISFVSLNRTYRDLHTLKDLGVLSVECKTSSIKDLLNDASENSSFFMYLVDKKGQIISQNDVAINAPVFDDIDLESISRTGEVLRFNYKSREYLAVSQKLSISGWNLLIIKPNQDFQEQKGNQIFSAILIGLLCLVASVLLMIAFSTLITKRLEALMDRMRNVKRYLKQSDITIVGNDEIGMLDRQFVDMTDKINELIDMGIKMERETNLTKAELLQSQINPHLLYNSLSAIRCIAQEKDNDDIASITDKLIRFYRISLNKGNIIVPLEDEIRLTEEYIQLACKIYDINLKYDLNIQTKIDGLYCMKLILQPVVENTLVHGFRGISREGHLSIGITEEEGSLLISVYDNGRGFPADKVETILHYDLGKKDGFGIYNVNKRIKLYFGAQYGMSISSQLNESTMVTIRIPLLRGVGETIH